MKGVACDALMGIALAAQYQPTQEPTLPVAGGSAVPSKIRALLRFEWVVAGFSRLPPCRG